ncbi:uncharacterized protein LOC130689955 [Daphnia carinata]|uniref:uncharacterized protein LOC130689955 n=1 Tax=Daphnia carinata TaxID=120202 RepID=UPI00257BC4CE|nr:uncharacterized protein LOC130689955 [Daphnia carinata]XP_057368891.1 uncharacterized protein LOC130689955 [Daphnia carinata]
MSVDVSDESSITAEWLESILHLYYSTNGRDLLDGPKDDDDDGDVGRKDEPAQTVRVNQFHVRPGCEEGENLLSDLLAIDVTVCRNGSMPEEELHLMAKLLSQDPFCRHFILEAGFDVREIHFYTTLMPALTQFCGGESSTDPWPVPSCFYAKYRQGSDSVLVLANMKASGFLVTEFHLGLELDEAVAAVQSIARIHASVLAYRLRLGVDLGQAFPFLFRPEAAAESYQQLLERGLPQLATFLHTSAVDQPELHAVLAKLHKMRPRARETIANLLRPASPIATLTHTDFWCNNLLFRRKTTDGATAAAGHDQRDNSQAGPVECSILDWQMATYSRPTNDLALLLVTSVAGEVRRTRTGHILDAYWNRFCETTTSLGLDVEGQLNYGRIELETEFQQSLLLAVLLGIGSVDLAIGHQATEERLCEVLIDLSNEKVF